MINIVVKVENMRSLNGNKVPNQFIIKDNKGNVYFQSYESLIVAQYADGSIVLDRNKWDYSKTTGKYRNYFLGEGITETRRKIADGTYKLADLN